MRPKGRTRISRRSLRSLTLPFISRKGFNASSKTTHEREQRERTRKIFISGQFGVEVTERVINKGGVGRV